MKFKTPKLERLFEIVVGLVLALAAVVPALLALGGPFVWVEPGNTGWAVGGSILSAAVSVWCVRTSWRLITGRRRPDGGLLSPRVIGVAGVVASIGVVFGLRQFGLAWLGGAAYLGLIALGCFELARRRIVRQRRRPAA